MQNHKILLGYWNFRGRAQVLRHLLAYTKLQWQQKTYTDLGQWYAIGDKTKLGLDFPNLPYLINGDFKMTESIAIARYIINKSQKKDLLGKNAQDAAKVDMVISLLQEIFSPTLSLFFSPNYSSQKTRLYDNKVKVKLQQLVHYINNKTFTIGYLTLADFKIAQASYYFEKLYPQHNDVIKALIHVRESVQNLPQIIQYKKSEKYINAPFLPSYSQLKF